MHPTRKTAENLSILFYPPPDSKFIKNMDSCPIHPKTVNGCHR